MLQVATENATHELEQADTIKRSNSSRYKPREIATNQLEHLGDDMNHDKTPVRTGSSEELYNRGLVWLAEHDWDNAIADFSKVIATNPNHADAYCGRGIAEAGKRDWPRALIEYSKAIALNPTNAIAFNGRGTAEVHTGRLDEAIKDYDEAIKLNPRDARLYFNRAEAWAAKGVWNSAIEDYTLAITLDSDNYALYNCRAVAHGHKGAWGEAIKDYDEAIKLNPRDARLYYNRGLAFSETEHWSRACQDYSKAISLAGDFSEAYNALAWLRATCASAEYRSGHEAVKNAERACELSQWKVPRFVSTLAAAYAEEGNFEAAIKRQQEALAMKASSEKEHLDMQERLGIYRSQRPFREKPTVNSSK